MDRRIVCFEIPAFEVALARRQDAQLRHWPVAVSSTSTGRDWIRELSREALGDGIQRGMPVHVARRLCPSLRVIPSDHLRLDAGQQAVESIVAKFAPVWEPILPGHLFLDLTGTHRLFGSALDTAARIEREIRQREGLAGAAGIASSKLVSNIAASDLQPLHLYQVDPGSERHFLAPAPVSVLLRRHRGLAPHTLSILDDLNLRTLGEIAEVPVAHLELALGRSARVLHDWACGIDPSPVLPLAKQPRLQQSVLAVPDEIDEEKLLALVSGCIDQLCRTLRRQQRLCGRLTLIIGYRDHKESRKSCRIAPSSCWESDLYPSVKDLWNACQRRVRVRIMTIRAEALQHAELQPGEQLSFFERPSQDVILRRNRSDRLALTLDRLRDRFGDQAIRWGAR